MDWVVALKLKLGSDRSQAGRDSGFVGSGFIALGMMFSTALAAAFLFYNFQIQKMSGVGIYLYYLLLLGLFYCSFVYQLNRFGASRRKRKTAVDASKLSYPRSDVAPAITILIPSYREERRVLVATILSAALSQYSNRKIVVLVDDPPGDVASLDSSLSAIDEVKRAVDIPMALLRSEYLAWQERCAAGLFTPGNEAERLADNYRKAARWLTHMAAELDSAKHAAFDHVDGFLTATIIQNLSSEYQAHASQLAELVLDEADIDREYDRLGSLFCADISSFQRKSFENLSHAPNKAMNLNAYIGLMGGRYTHVLRDGKHFLEESEGEACDLSVSKPEFVLTLDADSVILSKYMLSLVNILNSNDRIGVAQTPYLTFPKAASAIERIAGATTDIQYLVHQGSSFFNAAYWVGANALIRYDALMAIEEKGLDGTKPVKVFIQDKTVIEDTGSTIDLLRKGWTVHNHFEPLAYSATPADFGSLAIQRKRWANGGLIIFPVLLREYLNAGNKFRRIPELLLRSHYLLSPVIGNVAVFSLMMWSSSDARSVMWTPLIMLPYFLLYGMDLRRLGYRARDLFGVCALNLVLLPVNFAGIASSFRQLLTGRKGSFVRTPKVTNRTFIPPYAYLFNIGILVLMLNYIVKAIVAGEYTGAIIPSVNVLLYAYGLLRFVGLKDGGADTRLAMGEKVTAARPHVSLLARGGRRHAGIWVRTGSRYAAAPVLAAALVLLAPWTFGQGLANGELSEVSIISSAPASRQGTEFIEAGTVMGTSISLAPRKLAEDIIVVQPQISEMKLQSTPLDNASELEPANGAQDYLGEYIHVFPGHPGYTRISLDEIGLDVAIKREDLLLPAATLAVGERGPAVFPILE